MAEVFVEFVLGTALRFIAAEFTKVVRYKQQLRPLSDNHRKHAELLRELESDATKKGKYRTNSVRFQQWSHDFNHWSAQTEAVIERARAGAKAYEVLKRRRLWEDIQAQMNSLSELRNDLPVATISCLVVENQSNEGYRRQPLPDNFVQPDDKLAEIIQLLRDKDAKWIGICGMGGSGKSVLASMVNNDMSVLEHFEGRVYFLSAHRNAVVKDLLVTLCHLLNLRVENNQAEDQLKSMLHDALGQQRTLLILDDVWEGSVLDGLDVLGRENGSKVLVTSRNSGLLQQRKGEIVSSRGLLSASSNKKLFCMHAFKDEEAMHKPELSSLVDEMAAACNGLPLALKVVGSSMVGKVDRQSWKASADKVKAKGVTVLEEGKQVSTLFDYSYEELSTLKDGKLIQECYLCMAAFESGARITLEELVALWRGDDLLPSLAVEEGEVCGWEEARSVLDVLVKRSLVEVDRGESGDGYGVHDVLRELILNHLDCPQQEHEKGCIFLAGRAKERRLAELFSSGSANKLQAATRVSLRASEIASLPVSEIEAPGNRVLLLDRNSLAAGLCSSIFKNFANLKVLSVRGTSLKELPIDICILKQLQVLDLRDSMLEAFPQCCYDMSSLAYLDLFSSSHNVKDFQFGNLKKLSNLEVLRLSFTSYREEELDLDAFPKLASLELWSDEKSQGSIQICSSGTTKLANLRHFALHAKVANFRKLSSFPANLESCVVRVGTMHGSWKMLFRGCTSLGLLDVGTLLDGVPAVEQFPTMTSFTLRGCSVAPQSFTSSLTSLVFWHCTFEELPEFMPGSLPLLAKLEFHSCLSLFHLPQSVTRLSNLKELRVVNGGLVKALLQEVPPAERPSKDANVPFCELRVLDLEGTRIKHLPAEVARSPKLETLSVSNCYDLEKIVEPGDGVTFPSLLELNFSNTKLTFDLLPPEVRCKKDLKTIC